MNWWNLKKKKKWRIEKKESEILRLYSEKKQDEVLRKRLHSKLMTRKRNKKIKILNQRECTIK